MKVIIAGGRDFQWNLEEHDRLEAYLDSLREPGEYVEIVCGGARGADAFGKQHSEMYERVELKMFPADWEKYGKSAGYRRNAEMAKYADRLLAFWDGKSKGTKHMIDLARREGLLVNIHRY